MRAVLLSSSVYTLVCSGIPKIHHEDIILVRRFVYRCMECDAIEADLGITIIPSWIWHQLRENDLEIFDGKLFVGTPDL